MILTMKQKWMYNSLQMDHITIGEKPTNIVANPTLSVIPNKPMYSLYNIEQWTTAFIRSMAIYAEKFPEAIPHLAKHAEMVRDGNISKQ